MRLPSTFASTDDPLSWISAVSLALGAGISAALAAILGGHALPLALATGAFLGMLAVAGPLVMAVRLIAVIGGLSLAAVVLADLTAGIPWLAAVIMAALALSGSLWTALPVVGPMAGGFPALLFLLVATKQSAMVGDESVAWVAVAAACGVLAAVIVAVLLQFRDPRAQSRRMVAAAWRRGAAMSDLGAAMVVLRLDARPPTLVALLSRAAMANLARDAVGRDTPVADLTGPVASGVAAADRAGDAIADVLEPRGPIVPRQVELDLTPMADGLATPSGREGLGLRQWFEAIRSAQETLSGARRPTAEMPVHGLIIGLIHLLLRPDASVFRFGIQRALGLGAGVLLLSLAAPANAFWILLTIFVVLQVNSPATAQRVLQRSGGTLAGVLLALLLATFVPAQVLVPYVAVITLLVGIAYMRRNYTVLAACMGAAIVWIVGVPDGAVVHWGVERVVDTVIGALVAYLLSRFVLPVRPRPRQRHDAVIAALQALRAQLAQGVDRHSDKPGIGRIEARIASVFSDYDSDIDLLPDDEQAQYRADADGLRAHWRALNALALLQQAELPDPRDKFRILARGLGDMQEELAAVREVP